MNNFSEAEREELLGTQCQYVIIGRERGAEGTPHLQGFIQFDKPGKTLAAVKKINGRAHWEMTKGNIDQNVAYCSKEGDFEERGTKPMSQKRKGEAEIARYDRARELAKQGNFDEIDSDIYIRHLNNLKKIRAEYQSVPIALDGELKNQWIWGPAGAGKTSFAFRENPGAYLKGLNKWWDGYVDHEVVIIDDMDPYHKALAQEFKVWSHHYPFPAETKGGTMCIRPKKIVVTSNYKIDDVWEDETTRAAIHRRFEEVYVSGEARGVEERKETEWDGRVPLHELVERYGSN